MKKILSLIVCLVLVIGIGVGAFLILKPKNNQASAIMTLQTNPEIQLVLDQNNKVMSVNAINSDGESLIMNVNFVGKSAEEAAKLFAEVSTNYGKIDLNTSGQSVNITIACEDETNQKYTELKTKVANKVNNYFKEIGVIAGAMVNVTENITAEVEKLGVDINEYANKTYKEIITDVESTYKELEGVALNLRDSLFTHIDSLKTTFSTMFNLEDQIADLTTQINNLDLKTEIGKAMKDSLSNQIAQFKNQYKTLKAQYEENIDEFVEQLKENSESTLATIKSEINTAIENGKITVQNHINAFKNLNESAKNAIIADIETFQNSLNAN